MFPEFSFVVSLSTVFIWTKLPSFSTMIPLVLVVLIVEILSATDMVLSAVIDKSVVPVTFNSFPTVINEAPKVLTPVPESVTFL